MGRGGGAAADGSEGVAAESCLDELVSLAEGTLDAAAPEARAALARLAGSGALPVEHVRRPPGAQALSATPRRAPGAVALPAAAADDDFWLGAAETAVAVLHADDDATRALDDAEPGLLGAVLRAAASHALAATDSASPVGDGARRARRAVGILEALTADEAADVWGPAALAAVREHGVQPAPEEVASTERWRDSVPGERSVDLQSGLMSRIDLLLRCGSQASQAPNMGDCCFRSNATVATRHAVCSLRARGRLLVMCCRLLAEADSLRADQLEEAVDLAATTCTLLSKLGPSGPLPSDLDELEKALELARAVPLACRALWRATAVTSPEAGVPLLDAFLRMSAGLIADDGQVWLALHAHVSTELLRSSLTARSPLDDPLLVASTIQIDDVDAACAFFGLKAMDDEELKRSRPMPPSTGYYTALDFFGWDDTGVVSTLQGLTECALPTSSELLDGVCVLLLAACHAYPAGSVLHASSSQGERLLGDRTFLVRALDLLRGRLVTKAATALVLPHHIDTLLFVAARLQILDETLFGVTCSLLESAVLRPGVVPGVQAHFVHAVLVRGDVHVGARLGHKVVHLGGTLLLRSLQAPGNGALAVDLWTSLLSSDSALAHLTQESAELLAFAFHLFGEGERLELLHTALSSVETVMGPSEKQRLALAHLLVMIDYIARNFECMPEWLVPHLQANAMKPDDVDSLLGRPTTSFTASCNSWDEPGARIPGESSLFDLGKHSEGCAVKASCSALDELGRSLRAAYVRTICAALDTLTDRSADDGVRKVPPVVADAYCFISGWRLLMALPALETSEIDSIWDTKTWIGQDAASTTGSTLFAYRTAWLARSAISSARAVGASSATVRVALAQAMEPLAELSTEQILQGSSFTRRAADADCLLRLLQAGIWSCLGTRNIIPSADVAPVALELKELGSLLPDGAPWAEDLFGADGATPTRDVLRCVRVGIKNVVAILRGLTTMLVSAELCEPQAKAIVTALFCGTGGAVSTTNAIVNASGNLAVDFDHLAPSETTWLKMHSELFQHESFMFDGTHPDALAQHIISPAVAHGQPYGSYIQASITSCQLLLHSLVDTCIAALSVETCEERIASKCSVHEELAVVLNELSCTPACDFVASRSKAAIRILVPDLGAACVASDKAALKLHTVALDGLLGATHNALVIHVARRLLRELCAIADRLAASATGRALLADSLRPEKGAQGSTPLTFWVHFVVRDSLGSDTQACIMSLLLALLRVLYDEEFSMMFGELLIDALVSQRSEAQLHQWLQGALLGPTPRAPAPSMLFEPAAEVVKHLLTFHGGPALKPLIGALLSHLPSVVTLWDGVSAQRFAWLAISSAQQFPDGAQSVGIAMCDSLACAYEELEKKPTSMEKLTQVLKMIEGVLAEVREPLRPLGAAPRELPRRTARAMPQASSYHAALQHMIAGTADAAYSDEDLDRGEVTDDTDLPLSATTRPSGGSSRQPGAWSSMSSSRLSGSVSRSDLDTSVERFELCTFATSGSSFMEQHWYFCYTCDLTLSKGCCSVCAQICHKGHKVVYSYKGRFFCDCGAGSVRGSTCMCLTPSTAAAAVAATSSGSSRPSSGASQAMDKQVKAPEDDSDSEAEEADPARTTSGSTQKPASGLAGELSKGFRSELSAIMEGPRFRDALQKLSRLLVRRQCEDAVASAVEFETMMGRPELCDGAITLSNGLGLLTLRRSFKAGSFEVKSRPEYAACSELQLIASTGALQRSSLSCSASGHLAVAEGDKVCILDAGALAGLGGPGTVSASGNSTGEKVGVRPLSRSATRFEVCSVKFNTENETHLAVVGFHDVQIFTLNSRGEVMDRLPLELGLAHDSTSEYIVAADWVPGSETQLYVTTTASVSIFDLQTSSSLAAAKIKLADQRASIASTSVVNACGDEVVLLLLTTTGCLLREEIAIDPARAVESVAEQSLTLPSLVDGRAGLSLHFWWEQNVLLMCFDGGATVVARVDARATRLLESAILYEEGQQLCGHTRWGDVAGHGAPSETPDGLLMCVSGTSGLAAAMHFSGKTAQVQELRAGSASSSSRAPVQSSAHVQGWAGYRIPGHTQAYVMLLHDDGSLQVYSRDIPPVGLDGCVLATDTKAQHNGAKPKPEPSFPIDFFESTTCVTGEVRLGGDFARNTDAESLKLSLAADDTYAEAPEAGVSRLVIHKPNPDTVIVGLRMHVGTSSPAHTPVEVKVAGRLVKLEKGVRRWYDLPLTTAEILQSDIELTLHVGPALNASCSPRIDNLEVYAQTKAQFGWQEKLEAHEFTKPVSQKRPSRRPAVSIANTAIEDTLIASLSMLPLCQPKVDQLELDVLMEVIAPGGSDVSLGGESACWVPHLSTQRAAWRVLREAWLAAGCTADVLSHKDAARLSSAIAALSLCAAELGVSFGDTVVPDEAPIASVLSLRCFLAAVHSVGQVARRRPTYLAVFPQVEQLLNTLVAIFAHVSRPGLALVDAVFVAGQLVTVLTAAGMHGHCWKFATPHVLQLVLADDYDVAMSAVTAAVNSLVAPSVNGAERVVKPRRGSGSGAPMPSTVNEHHARMAEEIFRSGLTKLGTTHHGGMMPPLLLLLERMAASRELNVHIADTAITMLVDHICTDEVDPTSISDVHTCSLSQHRLILLLATVRTWRNNTAKSFALADAEASSRIQASLLHSALLLRAHAFVKAALPSICIEPRHENAVAGAALLQDAKGFGSLLSGRAGSTPTPVVTASCRVQSSGGASRQISEAIVETSLRLGVTILQRSMLDEAATHLSTWTDSLCTILCRSKQPMLQRYAQRMLSTMTSSRQAHLALRDRWEYQTEFQIVKRLAEASNELVEPLLYVDQVELQRSMDQMVKIATARATNWQEMCLEKPEMIPALLHYAYRMDAAGAIQALKLITTAFSTGSPAFETSASTSTLSTDCIVGTDGSLTRFIRTFLLGSPSAEVRTQARMALHGVWLSTISVRERILQQLVAHIELMPPFGSNAAEFTTLLVTLIRTHDGDELVGRVVTADVVGSLVRALRAQNRFLSNHPHDAVYNGLSALVDMDGYHLETEPPLACLGEAHGAWQRSKLDSAVKAEMKYSDRAILVRLTSRRVVKSITFSVHEHRRSRQVKSFNVWFVDLPDELSELRHRRDLWQRLRTCTLSPGQTDLQIDLPIPVTVSALMIEFEDFYISLQAQSQETLQCPRCSRHVADRHGVCKHCRENAYQCRQCRNINYEVLDAFLCNECGHSRYGRFEVHINSYVSNAYPRVNNEKDAQRALAAIETEADNVHRCRQQLLGFSKPLSKLLTSIGEPLSDTVLLGEGTHVSMPSPPPSSSFRLDRRIAMVGVLYSEKCKAAADAVTSSTSALVSARQALTSYLQRQESDLGLTGTVQGTDPPVPSTGLAPQHYGCAAMFVSYALQLLEVFMHRDEWRRAAVEGGVVAELFNSNLHRGSRAVRASSRQVICTLIQTEQDAAAELGTLLRAKASFCLENHTALDVVACLSEEVRLLSDAAEKGVAPSSRSTWEERLKLAFELLFKAVSVGGASNSAVCEHVILPCLSIVYRASASDARLEAVGDCENSNTSVTYPTWKRGADSLDGFITHARRHPRQQASERPRVAAAVVRCARHWRKRVHALSSKASDSESQGARLLRHGEWVQELLLSPCSTAVRVEAASLLRLLSRRTARQRFTFLARLARLLPEACSMGEGAVDYFDLLVGLLEQSVARRFLAARGFLPAVCMRLQCEARAIFEQEKQGVGHTSGLGYNIKRLAELLHIMLRLDDVCGRFTREALLPVVLDALLAVRGLVTAKNKLTGDCASTISALLADLTATSAALRSQLVSTCVSMLSSNAYPPALPLGELCSIVCPLRPDPVYLLQLTKSATQEEFIRGGMNRNPYTSTDAGPTMRDVKNYVCRALDMHGLCDDDFGMELLVAGRIINLDLRVSAVFEGVWRKALASGQVVASTRGLGPAPCDAQGPPMVVTYRLQGLDGEATEPQVDSLDDDSQEQIDPEELYGHASLLSDCDGLSVLLSLVRGVGVSAPDLSSADEDLVGVAAANAEASMLLLRLLNACCCLPSTRRELLRLGALPVLVEQAQRAFESSTQEETAASLLLLLEQVVEEDVATFEEATSPGPVPSPGGVAWMDGEPDQEAVARVHAFLEKLSALLAKGQRRSADTVARILPGLATGDRFAAEALVDHFLPVASRLSELDAGEDRLLPEVESFIRVAKGIRRDSAGGRLRGLFLERGVPDAIAAYLLEHAFPLGDARTKGTDAFTKSLSLPALPLALALLEGLASHHRVTGEHVVRDASLLNLLHALEGVPSEREVGSYAENVLEAIVASSSTGANAISALRSATKEEARKKALARREEMLREMGMQRSPGASGEKIVVAGSPGSVSSLLDEMEDDADEVIECVVCGDGYRRSRGELLGVYTFCKVAPLPHTGGLVVGCSTVTHFNAIHFTCHTSAKRADTALKVPKKEWDGATLRNHETLCNNLLPVWGPGITSAAFDRAADAFWENVNAVGRLGGSRARAAAHDVASLLHRFATGASFSEDSHGGGRESNAPLVPLLVALANRWYDRDPSERAALSRSVQSFVEAAPRSAGGKMPRLAAEQSAPFALAASVLVWSLDEWLQHRRRMLVRAVAHGWAEHVMNDAHAPLTGAPSDATAVFEACHPMLNFFGLVDHLHRALKPRSASACRSLALGGAESGSSSSPEDKWQDVLRRRLEDPAALVESAQEMIQWVEDIETSEDAQEAFDVMEVLSDVLSEGCDSADAFVLACVAAPTS